VGSLKLISGSVRVKKLNMGKLAMWEVGNLATWALLFGKNALGKQFKST